MIRTVTAESVVNLPLTIGLNGQISAMLLRFEAINGVAPCAAASNVQNHLIRLFDFTVSTIRPLLTTVTDYI